MATTTVMTSVQVTRNDLKRSEITTRTTIPIVTKIVSDEDIEALAVRMLLKNVKLNEKKKS